MHPVITKAYEENLRDGVMVCGINFGFSLADEEMERSLNITKSEAPSFFSDKSVNNTRFRNTVLKWLKSWGLPFSHTAGAESVFDRSFFQTNWLNTQTRSVHSDEKITESMLVNESDGILGLIEDRKPSVILFFGAQMIRALNDISIRSRVVSALGERSGDAVVHQASPTGHSGTRFKMLTQTFGDTLIISLPHPQTIGITDAYVAALKPPPEEMAILMAPKSCVTKQAETGVHDPFFHDALASLPVEEELPISFLQRKFRIGHLRARLLHEAIKASKGARHS